ncbi:MULTISPECIES: DUF302 domain-containing protein [unclassified Meiothermus]|uniref:DUF302 domain-containing protein n=1 Tax=unclassified Meiothermus TaxID=370471 RepID=UPI000D7BB49B|nr:MULTISPECIES: DUF302 domain-containing protein [unclassified Meiothermus]PZA07617.1 hypothetical protein DNA98_08370 [Meiothermus sp. Pnk-1]RYM29403.1 DUF302 domain-containing protein [Meiothermus sp. PNK-Is4]
MSGDLIEVRARAVEALKAQGFGILSEIKDPEGEARPGVRTLPDPGACNPNLARQALDTDRDIGLLLPCNVVLHQLESEVGEGSTFWFTLPASPW